MSRLEQEAATYTSRSRPVNITMFSILGIGIAKLTLTFNGNKLVGGGSGGKNGGGKNGGDDNCFEGLHG